MTPDQIAAAVEGSHKVQVIGIVRVASGQTTLNYRCDTSDGRIFVKVYPDHLDLRGEEQAVRRGAFAGHAGVPVARIRPAADGTVVVRRELAARYAVWDYVDGQPLMTPMSSAHGEAIGSTVGRLHRCLREYTGDEVSAGTEDASHDLLAADREISRLLHELQARASADDFDRWAMDTLQVKRALLPRVGVLQAGIPRLARQPIHGDVSAPNVLYRGDKLVALIDFSPSDSHLTAWEISRIGCDAQTILQNDHWIDYLVALASGYRSQNPEGGVENLIYSVRLWLCATVVSTYAIRHIVSGRAALPELFKTYAISRHEAMLQVLDRLFDLEGALRDGIAQP